MADLEQRIEQELIAAARRSTRLRYARSSLPRPIALAAAAASVALCLTVVGAAVSGVNESPGPGPAIDERPVATPSPQSTFAEQLAILEVLRERRPEDDDPQVRAVARGFGPDARRSYGRLLGKAPSGSAFVLIPLRRYETSSFQDGRTHTSVLHNVTCLMRRGNQGGAGACVSTAELRERGINGAIAGQYYGVVPDGVASIRLYRGAESVPVRRNFWVTDDPGRNTQISIQWLDEQGRVIKNASSDPERLAAELVARARAMRQAAAVPFGGPRLDRSTTRSVIEDLSASVPLPPDGNFNGIRWPAVLTRGDIEFTLEFNAACQWARAHGEARLPRASAEVLPMLAHWPSLRTTNSARVWQQRAQSLLRGGKVPQECIDSLAREQAYARAQGLVPTR